MEGIYFLRTDPTFTVLHDMITEARETYSVLIRPRPPGFGDVVPPDELYEHAEQVKDIKNQLEKVLNRYSLWRSGQTRSREVLNIKRQIGKYQRNVIPRAIPHRVQWDRFLDNHQEFLAILATIKTMFGERGN